MSFDTIDHEWLVKFLEHRIGDHRILRLIRKWLRAGVSEEGQWSNTTVGAPQGSVISPLLSNVYLHYVFDLWIEWWRKHRCRGDMIVVRYAIERRERRDGGRPDTFDFLGFTHKCARTRKQGWYTIHRHSVAKRMRATLQAIKDRLRKRMHRPLGETARWLRSVLRGWLNYHAVPSNSHRINRFVDEVTRLWLRVIRRRSQCGRRRWTWARMQRLARRHLPRPRIVHPYPNQRFHARLKAGAV